MPQETNLNVSPYFDDFDEDESYHKVLFKPGYPVQARELTTLQSILQNQIEKFGTHFFKEGSVVIPGNVTYKNDLNSVKLENTFGGISSDFYLSVLVKKRIRGERSGITAVIEDFLPVGPGIDNVTIFVRYLSSDSQNNSDKTFYDGENLVVDEDVTQLKFEVDVNTFKQIEKPPIILGTGEAFATTVANASTSKGSAVLLQEGVYFIRGTFVNVPDSRAYINPYSNISSAKVGFRVFERIVNAFEDEDLYDNAQGFSNFAAPGADRLSITTKLEVLPLETVDAENFIQLIEIRDGEIASITKNTSYNIVAQEFARRTYDESGDYYIDPPIIKAQETLNDLRGNDGIFSEGQLTYDAQIPASDEVGTYNISPMKAYVRGFEVETVSPVFLDFPKTRTTKTLENQSINYFSGSTFTLNRVHGSPIVSTASTYFVSLRDSRVGTSQTTPPGNEIGVARVYDFALESGSYSTSNPNENEWDISLYDVQTYTNITLNEPITLTTPTHIRGKESGAIGFLRYNVSAGTALTVYDSKGKFSLGEKLIFDGVENTRVIRTIRSYGTSDVKSIYGIVGTAYTFTADTIQKTSIPVGQVRITAADATLGISTVTSTSAFFVGIATVGNLVAFSNQSTSISGLSTVTFARIQSVSDRSITIAGVTSVTGVCDGALPTTAITPSDFRIVSTSLQESPDNSLYTRLPKSYVASVDLTDSNLIIRRQFDVVITSNSTGAINAGPDETFLPFDEERYVLVGESGLVESLSQDEFSFTNGSKTLTINGLSGSGNAKLIATLRKTNVKSKIKNKNRIRTLIIDKSRNSSSGIGSTTLNDGLSYGNYPYGTRVQDEEICLLVPDVMGVYAVYETTDTNDPTLPSLVLTSLSGPTNKTGDLLLGEEFIGETSQAIGVYTEKINDLKVEFSYLNSNNFIAGEKITFRESKITAFISLIDEGDTNISSSFALDANQKETIYDYSKLIRNKNSKEPTRKLKIVFESASFSDSDTGDLTTANSYEQFDYCSIKSVYDTVGNTDIIDVRPRVSPISPTVNSRSPFEFLSRSFTASGNSARNILASDESILLSYSFYLPRIDKIVLDKTGFFQLVTGIPDENPQIPFINDTVLDVATAYLPPYICNINEVDIQMREHKRYTMADISRLEDRIETLEYYTSLSLLETNTATFNVTDSNGINRFKSGFFVDNFSTTERQDKSTIVKNSVDINNLELRPTHYTTSVDLLLGTNSLLGIGNSVNTLADPRTDTSLIGTGVKRTGQLVTLDYDQVLLLDQPYASRAVNVNPYAEDFYNGTIQLFPSSDVWVDQVRLSANTLLVESNFIESLGQFDINQQSGFSPITWNSHESAWAGNGSMGTKVLDTKLIPFMRSRNIEFIAKRLKPLTRVYSFFGGIDVNKFIVPKLLEITMTSGVFQVGEDVIGTFDTPGTSSPKIFFRVAKQNHKYGTYDNPSDVYVKNPYNQNINIPDSYSATSTILNVDTYTLSNQPNGLYEGYIAVGMKLRGLTSKAEARISDIRLITDQSGAILGSFFIPDGNITANPKFECGSKVFRLTSSRTNSTIFGTYSTSAEEKFLAEGKVNVVQDNIIVTRPPRYEAPQDAPYISSGGGGWAPSSEPVDNGGGFIGPEPPPPVPVDTRREAYFNKGKPGLSKGDQKRLITDLMAAGMNKKDAKALVNNKSTPSDIASAVEWFNNTQYSKDINKKLINETYVNGVKTKVETSAQETFKGDKRYQTMITAGDKTIVGGTDKKGTAGRKAEPTVGPGAVLARLSLPTSAPTSRAFAKSNPQHTVKNPPAPAPAPAAKPSSPPSSPPSGGGVFGGGRGGGGGGGRGGGGGGGGGKKSDIRLKRNITAINSALNMIINLSK